MVVGAFPAFKLVALAARQIAKPIAEVIKSNAKKSQFFRKYICMPPAQFYNWVEVKTKMWALNLGKPAHVPKLNEAMAIELGANLLGEFIIFSVGASVLFLEYTRQSNKEQRKEEALAEEKAEILGALRDLSFRLEKQEAQIRELTRLSYDLDSRSWFKITKQKQELESPAPIPTKGQNLLEIVSQKCKKIAKNASTWTSQQTQGELAALAGFNSFLIVRPLPS